MLNKDKRNIYSFIFEIFFIKSDKVLKHINRISNVTWDVCKHRNQLSSLSIKFLSFPNFHENKQNQIQKLIAQRGSFTFTTTPPKLAFVLKTTQHILAIITGLVLKILNLIDLVAKDHAKHILNANIGHLVSLQLLARKGCVI